MVSKHSNPHNRYESLPASFVVTNTSIDGVPGILPTFLGYKHQ